MKPRFSLRTFDQLTNSELYAIMKLRQEVFVVEQNCPYLDCDGRDQQSYHLLGWLQTNHSQRLVAYLRIISPLQAGDAPSIGRVVCDHDMRGAGIGKDLMLAGIAGCKELFNQQPIHISAQQYLVGFYSDLGFRISSDPYDEDGIPHIGMKYEHTTPQL